MNKLFFLLTFSISIIYSTQNKPFTQIDIVEQTFLKDSNRELNYPGENIPVIVTKNLPLLGKLTALHFIYWIQNNPSGVIALPTGKTPELFIKYLYYYKKHWHEENTQVELKLYGVEPERFPDTSNLKFVQIDEFFPIDSKQENSFTHYVDKYYLKFLGLKKENVLTIGSIVDSIIKKDGIEKSHAYYTKKIAVFCENYEKQIRKWGGIGFFLGGIGPDGHIAFNQEGSDHNSKTRLIKLNYKTSAAAAIDLGGIEQVLNKFAITIGLETICFNKNAEIIIIAAGESKGHIVAKAVESSASLKYPATSLQKMKGAKFYITSGCAKHLNNRKHLDYINNIEIPASYIHETLIEISLLNSKAIVDLTLADLEKSASGKFLARRGKDNLEAIKKTTRQMLINKIESKIKLEDNSSIIHTSPHHDDTMLSYYPLATKLIDKHTNVFCAVTSGFNSVTNHYLVCHLNQIKENKYQYVKSINKNYKALLYKHKKSCKKPDLNKQNYFENCIISKKIAEVFEVNTEEAFSQKLDYLLSYFKNTYPGQRDIPIIQELKGAIRETEEERVWHVSGAPLENIIHLRSKFYSGMLFDPPPNELDIQPMINLINKIKPNIITLALDPEGTGPDTHYKTLQLISAAILSTNNENLSIWGYRNIWHRFNLTEANLFFLVTERELDDFNDVFLNCYSTQKKASFPSPYYNGPFSKYAENIQIEQLQNLKILIGEKFFIEHPDKRVRGAKGLILLKKMTSRDLLNTTNELKKFIEAKSLDFHDL